VLAQERHARRRRRHHHLGAGEHPLEAPRQRLALGRVPGVAVHLPAARLLHGELDRVPEALEHLDHGAAGPGEQRVVEAGDEEGDPHRE
jgi:hypothetical protein